MRSTSIHRFAAAGLVTLFAVVMAYGQAETLPGVRARFPRQMLISGARIVVHAPQVESWTDHETLVAWQAVEATLLDDNQPHVGVVKVRARTTIDKSTRMMFVHDVEVLEMHFKDAPADRTGPLVEKATSAIQAHRGQVPLDLALAYVAQQQKDIQSIALAPGVPAIHLAGSPTILVLLEGDPVFAPLEGTGLRHAVNTNWDLFLDTASGSYYLRDDERWLTATDWNGVWQKAASLPEGLSQLPAAERWNKARAALPWKESVRPAPRVVVSTRPAELILIDGEPVFRQFPDTFLNYVDNTDSDVFLELTSATYYFLVAGRWFQAPELQGPWTVAGPLPEDFARIPADGPRADVLASVPGTWEARMALQEARIPRKARVEAAKATLQVAYDGEPRFEPIPGTSISRAVNTQDQVLQIQADYFACKLGVWFVGSSPTGKWLVAREVPAALYDIPPSSPAYPVTYVRIYGEARGRITFGYTPGYERIYLGDGAVVFGTGHYRRPYLNPDAQPPVYHPGFSPYGVGAYYDLSTGSYRRTRPGPYAGAGVRDVGMKSLYSAWGPTVAVPEEERQGTSQQLASRAGGDPVPTPEEPVVDAAPDLYVGPDQQVYQHEEDRWSRASPYAGQDISGSLGLDEDEHARSYLEKKRANYNARKNAERNRRGAW
jgi:hypothetical protein